MHISSIWRYPVKGLTAEHLPTATLMPGQCLPWDRAFALVQGDAKFDPANPTWLPKTNFMCLLRNAQIAKLRAHFDETSKTLTVSDSHSATCTANPFTESGQANLTSFLIAYLGSEARFGPNHHAPSFLYVANHSFCDHQSQVVSLIGLGSLRALEDAAGGERDVRRFRANIYIEDIAPWAEFGWLGKTIRIGDVTLEVQDRIDRCGATTVNPDTAIRDANPVLELQRHFGHIELGVFAKVLTPGSIKQGDPLISR